MERVVQGLQASQPAYSFALQRTKKSRARSNILQYATREREQARPGHGINRTKSVFVQTKDKHSNEDPHFILSTNKA